MCLNNTKLLFTSFTFVLAKRQPMIVLEVHISRLQIRQDNLSSYRTKLTIWHASESFFFVFVHVKRISRMYDVRKRVRFNRFLLFVHYS